MEIYASSYQIIRYHDQFTWAKMQNFYFAVEAFFKENFFFSFLFLFSISFINSLAFNEKETKHNKMKKKFRFGSGESLLQSGK